jgi:hypothetical protein
VAIDALSGCQKLGASAIESGHFMGRIVGAETWLRKEKYNLLFKPES